MQHLEEDGELARMLAEQEAFLASREAPAAKVVRRQEGENGTYWKGNERRPKMNRNGGRGV